MRRVERDLRRGHGPLAAPSLEGGGALGTVALDWRSAFRDLMAMSAIEQHNLQPLAGSARAGERDFVRLLASSDRITPDRSHIPDGHGLQLSAIGVDARPVAMPPASSRAMDVHRAVGLQARRRRSGRGRCRPEHRRGENLVAEPNRRRLSGHVGREEGRAVWASYELRLVVNRLNAGSLRPAGASYVAVARFSGPI